MRLLVRAGAAQDPAGKPGVATLVASLLDQGTTTPDRRADRRRRSTSIGGALGAGAGTDLTLRQHGRDEGQLRARRWTCCPTSRATRRSRPRRSSGSGSRSLSALQVSSEDPEYIADAVFDRLVYGFHPYGLPGPGTPETIAAHHARRSRRVPQGAGSRRTTRSSPSSATSPRDEAFAGAERAFGDWAAREATAGHAGRAAAADAPRRRHRQARRGADRDSRRATSASRASTRTTWRSTWRSRSSAARAPTGCTGCCASERGLTYGASGRHQRAQGRRRHRGRDRHAVGGDRRGAAADGGRVLAAPARAGAASASWPTPRRI